MNTNGFVVRMCGNDLTLEANGDASLTGHLDVGSGAASSKVKAYEFHAGNESNIELYAIGELYASRIVPRNILPGQRRGQLCRLRARCG